MASTCTDVLDSTTGSALACDENSILESLSTELERVYEESRDIQEYLSNIYFQDHGRYQKLIYHVGHRKFHNEENKYRILSSVLETHLALGFEVPDYFLSDATLANDIKNNTDCPFIRDSRYIKIDRFCRIATPEMFQDLRYPTLLLRTNYDDESAGDFRQFCQVHPQVDCVEGRVGGIGKYPEDIPADRSSLTLFEPSGQTREIALTDNLKDDLERVIPPLVSWDQIHMIGLPLSGGDGPVVKLFYTGPADNFNPVEHSLNFFSNTEQKNQTGKLARALKDMPIYYVKMPSIHNDRKPDHNELKTVKTVLKSLFPEVAHEEIEFFIDSLYSREGGETMGVSLKSAEGIIITGYRSDPAVMPHTIPHELLHALMHRLFGASGLGNLAWLTRYLRSKWAEQDTIDRLTAVWSFSMSGFELLEPFYPDLYSAYCYLNNEEFLVESFAMYLKGGESAKKLKETDPIIYDLAERFFSSDSFDSAIILAAGDYYDVPRVVNTDWHFQASFIGGETMTGGASMGWAQELVRGLRLEAGAGLVLDEELGFGYNAHLRASYFPSPVAFVETGIEATGGFSGDIRPEGTILVGTALKPLRLYAGLVQPGFNLPEIALGVRLSPDEITPIISLRWYLWLVDIH